MPRPVLATIHSAALGHNLARVRAASPDARVWAVVKANAYGHGIERVFGALRGADGFALLDLDEAARMRALDLAPAGLMCIPPEGQDSTPHFRALAALAGRNGLAGLSMGMSGDFEAAVAEGATHVRVGSAIFGARG